MKYPIAFLRFWWEFIIGEDWLVAAGLVVAIGLTALATHKDVSAWWAMPLAVVALLSVSIWRATRHRSPAD